MNEIWKPVKGYEGLYEVSNEGRVRSLDREVKRTSKLNKPCLMSLTGRLIKPRLLKRGYLAVDLYCCGNQSTHRIHRLVLEAFIGLAPDGMECCHYDDDPFNNHLSNLRWDTHQNNLIDLEKNGGRAKGSKIPSSLLTEAQVSKVKWALSHSFTQAEIARHYGVAHQLIHYIAINKTWRHINAF